MVKEDAFELNKTSTMLMQNAKGTLYVTLFPAGANKGVASVYYG
jgi:hypothetical protein